MIAIALLLLSLLSLAPSPNALAREAEAGASPGYELWLTDQNNTAGYSSASPRGTLATNPTEFSLYAFRDEYPRAPAALPDNDPLLLPDVFFRDASPHRDAHGMAITTGSARYLWQFDRLANVAELFRLPSKRHVGTVDLTASGVSGDPTPDIVARSPKGDRFYAALRGPRAQTGAHASAGSTPGLGIVSISDGGAGGSLTQVLRTSLTNPIDGGEESDPHGIVVRRSGP